MSYHVMSYYISSILTTFMAFFWNQLRCFTVLPRVHKANLPCLMSTNVAIGRYQVISTSGFAMVHMC